MDDEASDSAGELASREPTTTDLVNLCRALNDSGAKYLICGGFAIRAAGNVRNTGDIDLLIDTEPENEAKVFSALEVFPDKAVRELDPGDVAKYTVVRVADEVVVDVMQAACGIGYTEASTAVVIHEIDGVKIPFASPELLWRMKIHTHREKDRPDIDFLGRLLQAKGIQPPH